MLLLAVGSVPILLLDFVLGDLPQGDRYFVLTVNVVVLLAFLVDYCVGLSLATSKTAYIANEKLSAVIVVVSAIALVPTIVWLSASSAFTIVEDVGVNGRYESFSDSLWWAAATITTVGYGDIVPVTTVGRAVGILCMTLGITMFGLVTARLAAFLVADD
jgi:voltage-gated potassium channel